MTEFLTKQQIKDRGWTDSTIQKLLGEPDETKRNPVDRSGSPMKLWRRVRVIEVEQSEAWKQWFEDSRSLREKSSEAAKARSEAMREQLIQEAISKLKVEKYAEDTQNSITDEACEHWWVLKVDSGEIDGLTAMPSRELSEKSFLDRITRNYLRHEQTNYDALCRSLAGKIGRDAAYEALRAKADELCYEYFNGLK